MVKVSNLTKKFEETVAVDDVSFEIKTGEILGFLGPNGAGKSTTMKIITCYMPPTSGKVEVDGLNVLEDSLEIRRKIGYLPETCPIYGGMSVYDYLSFIADIRHIEKSNIKNRIEKMVEICGLKEVIYRNTDEISKGYKQRVGLAQSIIHDPDILILDEPWTGLDPIQIIEIRNLIREIGKEKTVLFSSHILQEVEATCDRVLVIHKGKIVADDNASKLKQQFSQNNEILIDVVQPPDSFAQDIQSIKGIKEVKLINKMDTTNTYKIIPEEDKEIQEKIMKKARDKEWNIVGINKNLATLEDVFKELTKM